MGLHLIRSFCHLPYRYTGTQVCNDPERNIITILLTNRCYPNDPDTLITQARIDFNNAVKTVVDSL